MKCCGSGNFFFNNSSRTNSAKKTNLEKVNNMEVLENCFRIRTNMIRIRKTAVKLIRLYYVTLT
jgi:hypothetical protein